MWRPVAGTWSRYEISDQGRVRSRFKTQWARRRRRAGLPSDEPWRLLRPSLNPRTGYLSVQLGRGRWVYVHHLVLEAFVSRRPLGKECRHLNGMRGDNRVANLAWGTRRDQQLDQRVHGTYRLPDGANNRGARNGRAILNETAVRWIKTCGLPTAQVAERLGIADTTVRNIRNGYRWKHVQATAVGSNQKS
jgi:hypothetical protein